MTDIQRWLLLGAVLLAGAMAAVGALLLWPLEQPSHGLEDYASLWRAIEANDLETLEALGRGEDGLGWHASLAAGRAHAALGQHGEAVRWLARARALWPTAEARREYARALQASGHPKDALREWELLLPGEEAARAVAQLAENPLVAAQLLNRRGAYARALELVTGLQGEAARVEAARALAGLARLPEAVDAYQAYLEIISDPAAQAELGRVLERSGKTDEALSVYRDAGTVGGFPAGQLLESLGRTDEAIQAYLTSTDPEATWRAAVLLERGGQTSEALSLYLSLARGDHRVWDDAALRAYRILSRQGTQRQADELLAQLPPAARYLLGDEDATPVSALVADPPQTTPRAVQVAEALLRQLPEEEAWTWARAELEVALRRGSLSDRLTIGEWYLAHGEYASACRVGVAAATEHPSRRAYRLAYPRAWSCAVARWSGAYNVDPLLVWAVMREESHFRVRAVSGSDARGVMQLLPSTARWIAEDRLGLAFTVEELFDPAMNLRLGTWYLGYLGDQFPQNAAWAVAAYNGGQGNLRRWAAPDLPLPDLPAALGSVETREYVSKVLDTWLVYRWLYGD